MATFKVGQRVKKIRNRLPGDPFYSPNTPAAPIGSQGTVVGFDLDGEVLVEYDAIPAPFPYRFWAVLPYMLSPLTDPGFEAFMQSVLRPVNLDQPEKVRV